MRRYVLGLVAGLAGIAGCQQDEPEPTWRSVQGIFVDHGCTDGSCHSSGNAAGGLTLETSADELVNVPCSNANADDNGLLRVVPSVPEASFLMLKLELTILDPALGMPMPPTGDALDDDELDLVEAWILAGAPNE